jgi:hypothetical protein
VIVDHEAVLADLEAHLQSKGSWGRRELIEYLSEARARHRVPEGLSEKALRLYGPQLIEVLRGRPATPDSEVSGGMDGGAIHRVGDDPHEGAPHEHRDHRRVAA